MIPTLLPGTVILLDHVGRLLADHQWRCIRVAGHNLGHS